MEVLVKKHMTEKQGFFYFSQLVLILNVWFPSSAEQDKFPALNETEVYLGLRETSETMSVTALKGKASTKREEGEVP
jgi:hypothetical protein